jgi:hypothetical protein
MLCDTPPPAPARSDRHKTAVVNRLPPLLVYITEQVSGYCPFRIIGIAALWPKVRVGFIYPARPTAGIIVEIKGVVKPVLT